MVKLQDERLSSARCIKVCKETVQGVAESEIITNVLVAALLPGYSPDTSPHIPCVVVVKMLFNVLFVPVFSQLNALFKFFPGPALSQPVT